MQMKEDTWILNRSAVATKYDASRGVFGGGTRLGTREVKSLPRPRRSHYAENSPHKRSELMQLGSYYDVTHAQSEKPRKRKAKGEGK